jgi:hypothetical protein
VKEEGRKNIEVKKWKSEVEALMQQSTLSLHTH